MNNSFELGPIRPPSEAQSILLRVTRNCPWNKCAFCHTYKNTSFSRREKEDVIKDIDSIYTIYCRIAEALKKSPYDDRLTENVISDAMENDDTPLQFYHQVAYWMQFGLRTLFLQDANSLILKTSDLVEILNHIKKRFPYIKRITSYARAKTISKKSIEELKELRTAGLSRIHIGLESGSDKVLTLIKKGVTAEEHIIAGKKSIEAGFDLSEYYMPGIGGKDLLEDNAIESARVLNEINPTFIRIRSAVPLPGTTLHKFMTEGKWKAPGEADKVTELKLFIEKLEGITSTLTSDHIMNLLDYINGTLPADKDKMIDSINQFITLSNEDKESFIIGKRLGHFSQVSDFSPTSKIDEIKKEIIKRYNSIDDAILDVVKNYI